MANRRFECFRRNNVVVSDFLIDGRRPTGNKETQQIFTYVTYQSLPYKTFLKALKDDRERKLSFDKQMTTNKETRIRTWEVEATGWVNNWSALLGLHGTPLKARATQQSARDNDTHLGGGGRRAAIQPIRPFLAISAHLLLGQCALAWSKTGRKETHLRTWEAEGDRSNTDPCPTLPGQNGAPLVAWAGDKARKPMIHTWGVEGDRSKPDPCPTLHGHIGAPLQTLNQRGTNQNVAQKTKTSPRY